MKKRISKNIFYFSRFIIELKKEKRKENCFWIYFDLKSISKNKNQNFGIHFLISNQKINFKKFSHFSILVMKLKNEKRNIFKIRFVFKSKNELYFRIRESKGTFGFCFKMKLEFEFFLFFVFIIKLKNEFQIINLIFNKNWKMNFCSFIYEIFSSPKHSSDQSYHLSYP